MSENYYKELLKDISETRKKIKSSNLSKPIITSVAGGINFDFSSFYPSSFLYFIGGIRLKRIYKCKKIIQKIDAINDR